MHRDNKLADDLIGDLAKVYRFTLDKKDMDLIPIMEETESLEPILNLFKAKYKEEGIKYSINYSSDSNKYVIPGTMQLLLENAIFQNIISASIPLFFEVEIKENELKIKYSLNKKLRNSHRLEEQISKLKKAYRFYTNQQIDFEEKDRFVFINIPLLDLEEE